MPVFGIRFGWIFPIIMLSAIAACSGSPRNVKQDILLADQGYQEILKENYEKAEANLKVALSINPDNPYALLNLGVLYQNTGRVRKARQMYIRVLELSPDARAENSSNPEYRGKKLTEIAKENLQMLESY